MKRADLSDVVTYEGELYEVVAISDRRTVILAPIGKSPCPACGDRGHVHLVEESRLFQNGVHPVSTVVGESTYGHELSDTTQSADPQKTPLVVHSDDVARSTT